MESTIRLVEQISTAMEQKGLYLCTAESCTGGLLGHHITNLPGASDFYLGGQVTYSNQAKQRWLGVSARTLSQFGAVSRETVQEMAQGIRTAFSQDYSQEELVGLSISGIAGPSGGTSEKPVGTVWIGLSIGENSNAFLFHFKGNREGIKEQSSSRALELLLLALAEH